MNTLRTIFTTVFVIASMSLLSAQTIDSAAKQHPVLGRLQPAKSEIAASNYARGLESDNDGLVESSLYYALQLRLAFPDLSFPTLNAAVDNIVKTGRTHSIRYKASLASTVFASPLLIDADTISTLTDPNEFFSSVAHQLERKLIVSNN